MPNQSPGQGKSLSESKSIISGVKLSFFDKFGLFQGLFLCFSTNSNVIFGLSDISAQFQGSSG